MRSLIPLLLQVVCSAPSVLGMGARRPLPLDAPSRLRVELEARVESQHLETPAHFLYLFGYQGPRNLAKDSHTFASVVRVNAAGRQEWVDISWLPADFAQTQQICVFQNLGDALLGELSNTDRCEPIRGHSFRLAETLAWARGPRKTAGIWGPFEITPHAFALGARRLTHLRSGQMKYIADDRDKRETGTAINCMHAVSDLTKELSSSGGVLGTGYRNWGLLGSQHALAHMFDKGRKLFKEQVDVNVFRKFESP